MQCYTDLTPPTAVTASVCLPFLSASANNLIVAKTSLLQIFTIKSVLVDSGSIASQNGTVPRNYRRERAHASRLVLVGEYHVAGAISHLAAVQSQKSKSGGQTLLLAVRDAKLSLVGWNPEQYSISTVSIHYYERDDLQGPPWAPSLNQCDSILTVDPRSRCAALKFGSRSLAILPLTRIGDDLVIDDLDDELDDDIKRQKSSTETNGDDHLLSPSSSSFVLSLVQLDPALAHPMHLAFLYEYRDPTLGILSSRVTKSSALLHERKDVVSYTVYAVDLEQQASTTLLSVTGLPNDISTVVPLPAPVGGALLVGTNEIVHVGQAGKANGVAVNSLAKYSSSYPLVYQGDLELKLEGCVIEQLGTANGELLIITNSGELVVLGFRLDGRSVSGMILFKIPESSGGTLLTASVSCVSTVGPYRVFVGSQDNDAMVLGWSSRSLKQQRRQSSIQDEGRNGISKDDEIDAEDSMDDDLYADDSNGDQRQQSGISVEDFGRDLSFKVHDRLLNLAPLQDAILVRSQTPSPLDEDDQSWSSLDLVAATGQGRTSSLVRMNPTIFPTVVERFDIAGIQRLWTIHAEGSNGKVPEAEPDHHNVLLASLDPNFGDMVTNAYLLNGDEIIPLENSDFEPEAGFTVEIGTLLSGLRVVQVLKSELRSFDGDFGLAQIIPLSDNLSVAAASFVDTFVLLVGDDGRLSLLRADESGDLEETQISEHLSDRQWQSGCLFDDLNESFNLSTDEAGDDFSSVLMFLLDSGGGLEIFRLPNLETPAYTASGISFVPPFLSPDFNVKRSNARQEIVELLVAELGDQSHRAPFLILRSKMDDIVIYAPYHNPPNSSNGTLCFRKIDNHQITKAPLHEDPNLTKETRTGKLHALPDLGGYFTVFMIGPSASFIFKAASSTPKIIDTKLDNVPGIALVRTKTQADAIAYPGKYGRLTFATLPARADYSLGWSIEKIFTTGTIRALKYHEPSGRYIIATSEKVTFRLPHDEFHPEWEAETIDLLPQVDQDIIYLIDPSTWTKTDVLALENFEVVMCIENVSLETSENNHARTSAIAVGTALIRGEDINTQGSIYVLDVIPVVPEPGYPETAWKFKALAKHKDRGAVTAISQIGTEGFMLAIQGQKCMVRGLKEDGTLLPVAFIDAQCYIGVAKELRGTGLCMLADAAKGVWLAGYTEDPYHIKMLGKSAREVQIANAEFLPDGRGLCILLLDAETNIRVLRFDPHNPKSLSGQHLLNLSTFHTGLSVSKMLLLPRTQTSWERYLAQEPAQNDMDVDGLEHPRIQHQILSTSQTGAISLISPLPVAATGASSDSYRALGALQTYLTSTLVHPLGLSPKGYRNVEVDMSVSGRAIIDGNVLRRWTELGSWKKAEAIARTGGEGEWEVRALLEGVLGRGLGFL